jgi:hypothetical protein
MATTEKSLPVLLKITLSINQRSLNLVAADGPKVLKKDEQNPHTKNTYQQKNTIVPAISIGTGISLCSEI